MRERERERPNPTELGSDDAPIAMCVLDKVAKCGRNCNHTHLLSSFYVSLTFIED